MRRGGRRREQHGEGFSGEKNDVGTGKYLEKRWVNKVERFLNIPRTRAGSSCVFIYIVRFLY